jgi:hypothetical protein
MKKQKDFIPKNITPLPWSIKPGACGIWNGVVGANEKRVCNCRNIKDAELIVKLANKQK